MSDNLRIGKTAELLVRYRLARHKIETVEAPSQVPYDLVAFYNGKPIRIQVKSVSAPVDDPNDNGVGGYRWQITCGNSTKNTYKDGSFDMLAFVASDIERCFFSPPIRYKSLRKMAKDIPDEKFSLDVTLKEIFLPHN